MAACFALSIVTGALLFSYKPLQFAVNKALPYKLGLAAAAILFQYAAVGRAAQTDPGPPWAKSVAAASLASWFAVVLAGMALSLEMF